MIALRNAILAFAFALLTAVPASARIDDLPPGFVSSAPHAAESPQQEAVRATLDQATDSNDPIEAKVLDGIRRFYEARDFELLWLRDRKVLPQMTELRATMDRASEEGLDPASYPTPSLATSYPDDPARLAAADIEFSRAVARFVTHVASGRIRPTDISSIITLEPERPDIGEALTRLSQSTNVEADVQAYEPPHPQYRR